MSVFSTIAHKLKEMISTMIGARTIEQVLHVTPAISTQMEHAITLWNDMYMGNPPWVHEPSELDKTRVVSLGLPAMIASEKARTALIEMESEITPVMKEVEVENPNYTEPEKDEFGNLIPSIEPKTIIEEKAIGDTSRAEFLNEQYIKLKKNLRKQLEYGIAKGGLVIKPYVTINKVVTGEEETLEDSDTVKMEIEFDYIQADSFYPLAFDASGKITEAAFVQTKAEKDVIYRRLEYHKWQGAQITIINKAFKSTNGSAQNDSGLDLGQEIALTEIPEWKDLQPKTVINNVDRPLFGYFKMPEANTIDTSSPLGVSGFSRAVSLIKDADMQYSRLLWEYEGGEMAVNIDRDAFKFLEDTKGDFHTVLPKGQERLYRRVEIDEGDLFEPYAPQLRDDNYINGLNTILMRIEDVCGISRGTLSDSAEIARTATELKILKQRSYQANADIQEALEDCLRDVIYIMNVYATLYEVTPEGEFDVNFEWDDSIIVDVDEELNKRITLMQNGLTSKLENRMWYFGETERQAREALTKVKEEFLESMSEELAMQSNRFGNGE